MLPSQNLLLMLTPFKERPVTINFASLTSTVALSGGDRPQVYLRINTNGKVQTDTGDTGSAAVFDDVGWWLNTDAAPVTPGDWECKVTETNSSGSDSGTWFSSGLGSFHVLSTTRDFTLEKNDDTIGDVIKTITIEVRQKSPNEANTSSRSGIIYKVEILADP